MQVREPRGDVHSRVTSALAMLPSPAYLWMSGQFTFRVLFCRVSHRGWMAGRHIALAPPLGDGAEYS
jgi:hypothetical protein